MGMYDQLRIKNPALETFEPDTWYQTKDIECCLVDYEVDADGQLWELGICEVPAPDGARKYNHTGAIRVGNSGIYSYSLIFDSGKLTSMQVLPLVTKHDMLSIENNARDATSIYYEAARKIWAQFKQSSEPISYDEYVAWRCPRGGFIDPLS
jgi:hypothetical protein